MLKKDKDSSEVSLNTRRYNNHSHTFFQITYVCVGNDEKENCHEKEKGGVIQNFKRTLSRKGKKKEKNGSDATTEEENG